MVIISNLYHFVLIFIQNISKNILRIYLYILIVTIGLSSCSNKITNQSNLIKLDDKVNTDYAEYSAFYDNHSEILYYTTFLGDQDIYVSQKIKNSADTNKYEFSQPIDINRLMDSNYSDEYYLINTELNDGSPIISYDGNSLYFVGCNRPNGNGSCDIYVSTKNKQNKWTKAVPLDNNINSRQFESFPSITKNNQTLYFVSTRETKYYSDGEDVANNYNIWQSKFNENTQKWDIAAIVENVNTDGAETSPFISDDGKTLYFSSTKGENHLGGYDIYKSNYNSETNSWSKPINLGSEINSEQDELYFRIDYKNNKGYLTKSSLNSFDNFKLDAKYYLNYIKPIVPYPFTKILNFNTYDTYDIYMVDLNKVKIKQ